MDLGLRGRTVLVTGGSSGIGLAVVRALLEEGANVSTCARDASRLREALRPFQRGRCVGMSVDVRDGEAVERLVVATAERFGRIDGVAAIAGSGIHGRALELTLGQWHDEITGKVSSVLNVVKPAYEYLRLSDNPRVVTLTTPTATCPDTEMAAVSAARAAVSNLTRSLALDLAPDGILVNAVAVGLIDTPIQQDRHARAETGERYAVWLDREAARRRVPLGRAGRAAEVATLVLVALSPMLTYTTGSTFAVTGGLVAS